MEHIECLEVLSRDEFHAKEIWYVPENDGFRIEVILRNPSGGEAENAIAIRSDELDQLIKALTPYAKRFKERLDIALMAQLR